MTLSGSPPGSRSPSRQRSSSFGEKNADFGKKTPKIRKNPQIAVKNTQIWGENGGNPKILRGFWRL